VNRGSWKAPSAWNVCPTSLCELVIKLATEATSLYANVPVAQILLSNRGLSHFTDLISNSTGFLAMSLTLIMEAAVRQPTVVPLDVLSSKWAVSPHSPLLFVNFPMSCIKLNWEWKMTHVPVTVTAPNVQCVFTAFQVLRWTAYKLYLISLSHSRYFDLMDLVFSVWGNLSLWRLLCLVHCICASFYFFFYLRGIYQVFTAPQVNQGLEESMSSKNSHLAGISSSQDSIPSPV
jgi:hypothetical protein